MTNTQKSLWVILFVVQSATAQEAERRNAENELHAQPAIRITVGIADADIIGKDNRALQAAVDYVGSLGGGTVEIGPGEFLMRDSLHLRSRVTVRGAGERTVLKKDREYRTALAADGDYGEFAITVDDSAGLALGRGVYVASKKQRNFHGVCATILNSRGNYFTLSRHMNADILMSDEAYAATIYPVISGYKIRDARVENLTVDGNRAQNPTTIDGCRTAGIYLYRGDGCERRLCSHKSTTHMLHIAHCRPPTIPTPVQKQPTPTIFRPLRTRREFRLCKTTPKRQFCELN